MRTRKMRILTETRNIYTVNEKCRWFDDNVGKMSTPLTLESSPIH